MWGRTDCVAHCDNNDSNKNNVNDSSNEGGTKNWWPFEHSSVANDSSGSSNNNNSGKQTSASSKIMRKIADAIPLTTPYEDLKYGGECGRGRDERRHDLNKN